MISVVIPTFNRRDDLKVTIEAVDAQTYPSALTEVIVVDNASTDGTAAMVRALQEQLEADIRYYRKEPEGPGAARNFGAEVAQGDYVAFVDSDVTLAPEWLVETGAVLDGDDSVGQVGGKVIYDGHRDLLNAFGGVLSPIGLAWDAYEGAPVTSAAHVEETLWMSCSATLVRRSAFREAGGFDGDYFYAYEDTDLSWRLGVLGWKVLVVPGALAFHRVGDAAGRSHPRIVFHACKNRLRSLVKNLSAGRLAATLPLYLGYALVDAASRPPRMSKLAGIAWNIRALPETLRLRRMIQRARRRSDRDLLQLMSRRWFPEVRLSGRRRRPVPTQAADEARLASSVRDDRVA